MDFTNEWDLRRLAVILHDSNDAITVQDLYGEILAWNKGAEKMYGYSEKEALQMNISQIVPLQKQAEMLNYLNLIRSGEYIESFESTRETRDGRVLDVWLSITCLKDNSGNITSIATTERDITHIKEKIERQEQRTKILEGLLPICSKCKKIKDSEGEWQELETYIEKHSEALFTHGLCPECEITLYGSNKWFEKK
ncbi:PAS domain-containing protein [Spirochaeta isovalerica]|uniref:histidine kinase n=1 Tax=Spirochaeta isovalerica TaxID=150 RepID=A0A841RAH9_9SPIO|nr:PAS domain S-box protein [Spirochaeta isovalerica]MBB6479442.1 PAS domain S-box-containing protein [Spirochaeta isovalerica]